MLPGEGIREHVGAEPEARHHLVRPVPFLQNGADGQAAHDHSALDERSEGSRSRAHLREPVAIDDTLSSPNDAGSAVLDAAALTVSVHSTRAL